MPPPNPELSQKTLIGYALNNLDAFLRALYLGE